METELDILITGGTLLTMAEDMRIIENAAVGIRDGRIALIETGQSSRAHVAKETLDASGCVIMPGLVNTHTHVPMVSFRGLADDLPLMEWLQNHIWPVEAKYVSREMVYASSRLAIAEMILSGTTTFCDAYFYENSVAHAAVDLGMRAVVSQGFLDFPTPDNPEPAKKMEIAEKFVTRWNNRSPLITPALFCHTPYTCTSETLCTVKEAARRVDVPFLIHLSETREEVAMMRQTCGRTPVRYLSDLGVLDARTLAVHCNWLEEEEMDILAACGVKISHNPESNMKLASGIAPVPDLMKRGIMVGLGTDGAASNNNLDMFGEMAMAARLHKVSRMDPTVMSAQTVLKMATIDGARVLGMEDQIGSIEVGKCADIIIIDMRKPHLTPVYNLFSHLVYAASGADVSTSIINGRIIMADRQLLHADLPAILHEARRIASSIKDGGRGTGEQ